MERTDDKLLWGYVHPHAWGSRSFAVLWPQRRQQMGPDRVWVHILCRLLCPGLGGSCLLPASEAIIDVRIKGWTWWIHGWGEGKRSWMDEHMCTPIYIKGNAQAMTCMFKSSYVLQIWLNTPWNTLMSIFTHACVHHHHECVISWSPKNMWFAIGWNSYNERVWGSNDRGGGGF